MGFGVVVGTFYAEVGLGVVGFTLFQHDLDFGKAFFVAQVGKQGPCVLAPDAFRKNFGLGPQADDEAVFPDNLDVVGLGEGTAAQGDYLGRFVTADFGDDFFFLRPEKSFPFLCKDFGDGLSDPLHDKAVGVNEGALKSFCQSPAGAALAAGHETCKENMPSH